MMMLSLSSSRAAAAATAPALRRRALTTARKTESSSETTPSSTALFIKAGLPFVLFSVGAAFVLKNALEGKTKEYEASKGQVSKSEQQARMEKEQDDMMSKLAKIRKQDFDNTKRIERPEDILERRKRERDRRNVWYRRWGRWLVGKE